MNTSTSRLHSSWRQHYQIHHSNLGLKTMLQVVALQRIRSRPPRPGELGKSNLDHASEEILQQHQDQM